ncbi:FliM/FliN family flagellar motor switch protein [Gymnodinialimonas hymeniacidonis]|uniref:FliM/FliN family flagellar motor switch protein n=1 Tax=Gymnodinialimonas hymeniacidonis TaxID=3126508 RepID=UPI0034C5EBB4
MPATDQRHVLARKIAAHAGVRHRPDDLVPALEAGLTRAVRRAAAPLDGLNVTLEAVTVTMQASLDSALEALPEHGLIAATEDRDGRRGLLALEHSLVDALIEVQTTGRVEDVQGPARPVTRIDEALCRDFIDLFFAGFAHETSAEAGRDWPERIAYASQIKDRGQINLLLPSKGFHLLHVNVNAAGLKSGRLLVLLPADPSLARRATQKSDAKPATRPDTWGSDVLAALGPAPLSLNAVLLRLHMPLSKVQDLKDGDLVPFDRSDLETVTLEDDNGHIFARGKLGQIGGRRAVRLEARRKKGAGSSEATPDSGPDALKRAAKASDQMSPEALMPQANRLPLADGLGGTAGAEAAAPQAMPDLPMPDYDPDAPTA